MTKSKYKRVLQELGSFFEGDEKAQGALAYLQEKVSQLKLNHAPRQDSTDEFPIPREILGQENSYALFSDGACRGNPGPGAWGIVAQDSEGNVIFESSGADMSTTNNKMELEGALQALVHLLDYVEEHGKRNNFRAILFTDSKYVVNGMESWVHNWKRRNWKKADNKPPENVELWKELDRVAGQFEHLKFAWVKGHSGHPQNEFCDQLANKALDELT